MITSALLVVVVLGSTAAAVLVLRHDLTSEAERRALAIAQSVAEEPGLAHKVTTGRPRRDGPVEVRAEAVRRRTGALYVVVTDARGVRYSHPNKSRIGKKVSTSPAVALSGRDQVVVERGTLGESARGKVPLRDASGRVVGEVSVGISLSVIGQRTRQLGVVLGLFALIPLAVGLIGAVTLGRRLGRTTLGLQPTQMADLVREHEAVLHGVRDAVIAVDPSGHVTVTNPQAVRLLGHPLPRGTDPGAVDLPAGPVVHELLTEEPPPRGALRLIGETAVLATRLPVERDGRDLGTVLILRDRSDLDTLARELEATRALTDALRAQAHEHTNRLHALSGLLHRGHVEEAQEYLDELSMSSTWVPGLDDPYLAGLLAAKSATASEQQVDLHVTPETHVEGRLTRPLDILTVVGNLLDNAIRAAADGVRRPRHVDLTLLSDGSTLVVHIVDTGDGVAIDVREAVFEHGWTSRPLIVPGAEHGHGLGLALARHTARATGGDVLLRDGGGPPPRAHGATFEARLLGVLDQTAESDGEDRR